MEASPTDSRAQQVLHEADAYVRENPIPSVLCAVGIGFALGLLVRALERPSPRSIFEDRVDQASGYLSSLFGPVASQTKRAYRKSASAVHDAVENAKDIDVEDYTDPVVSWFSRIWNKCCG
ncbi:hypothetical protein ACXR0O_10770 [Verrucomicrobiota bacterium sgz303538]